MDIILLGITVVSLIVALVMSLTAWRLMRDDKQRSAARVAALSVAADAAGTPSFGPPRTAAEPFPAATVEWKAKAPWSPPRTAPIELPLHDERSPASLVSPAPAAPAAIHASGFLGASQVEREDGSRQKSLAFAAAILFVVLSGGLVWMMSGPEGSSAAAIGPNSPLELVSLTHARDNDPSAGLRAGKLVVSGLVRNPQNGKPIERLSAVVFLFDRMGTFVTSSRASVGFLKLGAGDETPFVVSLDAPSTVARYRVSFRTDDGIVPHVDLRSGGAAPAPGEQRVVAEIKN